MTTDRIDLAERPDSPAGPSADYILPEDIRAAAERVVRAVTYGDDVPPDIDAASSTEEFINDVVDDLERHRLLARPMHVDDLTDEQVEAAALAGARTRRGATAKVNDTDRDVARAVLTAVLGGTP